MTRTIEADYVVIGAGAAGMAFVDALTDHADVRVALVDRRHSVGGHWLEAYPFVRLHQASAFYGVASTVLGGAIQQEGPEKGLHERASQPEICDYYEHVLRRMVSSGRVELLGSSEYVGDRTVVSHLSGERLTVPAGCRIVDARYLAPVIPAETPPPFAVAADAHVVPVNDLVRLDEAPREYVVVGSGKTATDAIVFLLTRGVDPDAICWVRPRDPWMLSRAVVQPDPAVFLGMAADIMRSASDATSLDDLFLRMEAAGIMIRIDPRVTPTMAKAPTLATWELDLLRTVENVVRRGHLESVDRGKLGFADGSVSIADKAVVVHCAGDGLRLRPPIPVWGPEAITLQPIRSGFPCFGAALVGYVEATRSDDAEKNRLCPSSPYGNSLADWARMTVLGTRAAQSFSAEPDIKAWADRVAINPARVPPDYGPSDALDGVLERLAAHTPAGLARLSSLM
ncbi:NAD(P)-binding protein [Nocardioides sp. CER19]|uniref:NAD(P)-binding protein n=1 Tax=Nocardioides sp. CER19 TaxID=3038538 RepID=UPI0024474A52|nr:NAD(P)-binding protein [Nocardioides sp. CER19]MDH2414739.1 NAD(P)-binding protein [Nocardioides sp. CER19]